MSIDVEKLQGKITALQPSFELIAEMTGRPSTMAVMGLHADHYVREELAMNDVNIAVEQLMRSWQRPYWPAPEEIAKVAREVRRTQALASAGRVDIQNYIEEVCRLADERKWERLCSMADAWRQANPARFEQLHRAVKGDIKHLLEVIQLRWMVESVSYRQAFKDGAIVGACLRKAGDDERAAEKQQAAKREENARRFATTGEMAA